MIEIKNLYKRYHNHHGSDWVLKDINLTIPKGVSVGLIGPNGAGKSTLLRLIAGMDTPDRGEVIRHSRVSWPVGLSGGMQNNMTGRQNVKFVARAHGSNPAEIKRVIAFVEEFSEIGEAFDEPIRTYSSGMRSRVSFGLSLAFDFDVYISDEATAVGDRAFKAKAKELFRNKIGQASLIMVSHGEGILRELCEAGIYLNHGHAVWYDDISDAIEAYHYQSDGKLKSINLVDGLQVGVDQLTSEDIKIVRMQQKKSKDFLNGITVAYKVAKEAGLESDELLIFKRIQKKAKSDLEKINAVINETHAAKLNIEKKEVLRYQNSIASIDVVMDQKKDYGSVEISGLLKAKRLLSKRLVDAEARLNYIQGDD